MIRARLAVACIGAAVAITFLLMEPRPEVPLAVLDAVLVEPSPIVEPPAFIAMIEPPPLPEPTFEPVDAALAGLHPSSLDGAVAAVRGEVRRGGVPGAALVVGRGSRVVAKHGIGQIAPGGGRVVPDETVYDLASLTKVVATTTAVMLLVEDGRMDLDAPVSRYLPGFSGAGKSVVTVRHLLTHTSGLPAGMDLPGGAPDAVLRRIVATPLKWRAGERVEYSDLGPIILFEAAERAAEEPLEHLLARRVFRPLGMRSTGFNPAAPCERCAPTTTEIHGHVHDPLAQRLGGVAGNAGLFSTASDIGRFAAMLAGGGELEGVRVLKPETIELFSRRQPAAGTRALGWDTPDPDGGGAGGVRISSRSFGHTGFTGTSLWIDPDRGTWAVLLTNRTLVPRSSTRIQELRRAVNDHLADAVDLAIAD
jgi:CubicO group peptidase (beta-lactamase class C family)